MKVAFSVWNNRIAPVFDTARDFLIVEVTDGHVVSKEDLHIGKSSLFDKIAILKKHNIQRMV